MRSKRFREFDPTRYECETFRKHGGATVSDVEVSTVCSLFDRTDDGTVLDLGMGPGRVLRKLAQHNLRLVGMDMNHKMISHFARLLRSSSRYADRIDLVVADGENLPFRDNSFAGVVCVRALKYFENTGKGIREMCSVLEQNGRLVLEFPNAFGPHSFLKIPQFVRTKKVFPRLFRLSSVRRDVSNSGVQIDVVIGWHKFPPAFLNHVNNRMLVQSILKVEAILQRVTPPELMSRSVVISGLKRKTTRSASEKIVRGID